MKFTWHWLKYRKYVKKCIIRRLPNESRHRDLANPQGGGYEESPGAATRGMGM